MNSLGIFDLGSTGGTRASLVVSSLLATSFHWECQATCTVTNPEKNYKVKLIAWRGKDVSNCIRLKSDSHLTQLENMQELLQFRIPREKCLLCDQFSYNRKWYKPLSNFSNYVNNPLVTFSICTRNSYQIYSLRTICLLQLSNGYSPKVLQVLCTTKLESATVVTFNLLIAW